MLAPVHSCSVVGIVNSGFIMLFSVNSVGSLVEQESTGVTMQMLKE